MAEAGRRRLGWGGFHLGRCVFSLWDPAPGSGCPPVSASVLALESSCTKRLPFLLEWLRLGVVHQMASRVQVCLAGKGPWASASGLAASESQRLGS